jgi:hypothetical protein
MCNCGRRNIPPPQPLPQPQQPADQEQATQTTPSRG